MQTNMRKPKEREFKLQQSGAVAVKKNRSNFPQNAAKLAMEKNSGEMTAILDQLRQGMMMPKVRSNSELIERIDEYFRICVESETVPTVAGMCLHCGYSHYAFSAWKTGRRSFAQVADEPTTQEIIEAASSVLLGLTESMANMGKINPVSFVFIACNFHGMVQRNTVSIEQSIDDKQPTMTMEQIEEIAASLPDAAEWSE